MVNGVICFSTYNSRLLLTYYHLHAPCPAVTKPQHKYAPKDIWNCNVKSTIYLVKNNATVQLVIRL